MRAWGRENVPGLTDPVGETAAFIDYWRGVAGQRGVKVDWIATWRNWMRRAAERQPARTNGHALALNGHAPKPSTTDQRVADVSAAAARVKAKFYGSAQ